MEMRRIKLPAASFAVALLLSVACLAAKDNAPSADSRAAALRAAELARFEANVKADAAALDRLLSADLEYAHSNGKLDGKASFIESLTNGSVDYLAMTPDIQSLRVFGDAGVIRGLVKVSVTMDGTNHQLTIGYTDVWQWKDGRWQMTAWRSTRMPDTPADTNGPAVR
jgi:hypothetical protein